MIKHAIPSGLKLIGKPFHLLQHNDPKHTSILCKTYLQKKADQQFLHLMEHPPQSPDFNPIEYVWDELDRRLRKLRPRNHHDLWTGAQEAWKQISQDYLRKIRARIPRLCTAVIKTIQYPSVCSLYASTTVDSLRQYRSIEHYD